MRLIVDARPMAEPIHGGVGRVAFEIMDAFAAANPETEVVCATTGSRTTLLPQRLMDRPNVRHVHFKLPNKIWSLASMFGLVSLYSMVERRYGPADAFFMPNLGLTGRLPQGIPSVLLLHDLSFLIEPRWFTLKQRLWHRAVRAKSLIRCATRLLAVSETTKRDAVRLLGISADRIGVIPLGPTLSAANYRLTDSQLADLPPRYVLALGAGDPRKNAVTAIAAVKILRQERAFQDLSFIVVGEKRNVVLNEGRQTAGAKCFSKFFSTPLRSAQDDRFIQIISRPSDAELAALYAKASAFLYPSWYEGFGLPLHEAASFGTPCVASTSGALPETAPIGTIFANPAKPHHWAEALVLALSQARTQKRTAPPAWGSAAEALAASLIAQ
jgi:glycosyltransferase involved in cell wall biosynthesis